MPESLFNKRKNKVIVLLKRILHGKIVHLFKIVIKIMKIFNQTLDINSNAYKIDANFNLLLITLCVSICLSFKFTIFILGLNHVVRALSILILPRLFYLEFKFIFLNIKQYIIKIKTYKTNPIYHFMKPVKRSSANKLYSDLDYLWKMYQKKKQHDNLEAIKLTKRENDSEYLFEQLDDEIFKTLENYHSNYSIGQMATIKATDFELYKKLFMRFVMPVEVNCLKSKFEKNEKEFPFQENKMTPNMFLEVLDKLKVRLNETFTEDDYVEYKQWFSFVEYKINSIKQGKVNKK